MGKPSAPPAPDYKGAAQEQGVANLKAGEQSASLSNPNIYTPYGNQTVSYAPTGPNGNMQPTVTQSLTPDAQKTLDAQQRVQLGLANLGQQGLGVAQNVLGQPFQYDGPEIQTSFGNNGPLQYGADLSGVAKMPVNAGTTAQQAIMSRLQPQVEQNRSAMAQALANQGITEGSEAYSRAQTQRSQGENDLYTQAALQGLGLDMSANQQGYNQQMGQAGLYNQAMAQQFNQGQSAAQFGNSAALQRYQQQLAQYNQPLNQIAALMSGSQIQNPQFQQYTGANIQAAPVFQGAQAQGNYDMGIYGQKMAGYNSTLGGIADLGGAAATAGLFSDMRLKSNIERVGTHPKGFGIYEYDIFGRRERGVMAQEVREVMPEAVMTHPSGYLMVNYEAINV